MYVCVCVCMCVSTNAFVRRLHTHVSCRRVCVFSEREREREGEKQSGVGRTKRDREIRRRQVNGGRKREIMVQREDGRIIRALDGRKLEGQRRIARRWIDAEERARERRRERGKTESMLSKNDSGSLRMWCAVDREGFGPFCELSQR